jgi:hypothetical protein
MGVIVTSYPSLRSARASIRARLFLVLGSGSTACSINRTPGARSSNHTAEPMGDGPDGGLIGQSGQHTPEQPLKATAFLLDGSVRRPVEYSPEIFIALRRATAVVLFGAFVFSGTGSRPRAQLRRRGKCTGLHTLSLTKTLCIHAAVVILRSRRKDQATSVT